MKVSEDELRQTLVDLYQEGYLQCRKRLLMRDSIEEFDDLAYKAGYYHGMSEAAGALFLLAFGGEEMFKLFVETLQAASNAEAVDVAEGIVESIEAGEDADE